ncbi:MAG: DUF4251 domain-containing protein [Parabacteroides sp.]
MKRILLLLTLLLMTAAVSAQTDKRIYTSSEQKAQQSNSTEKRLAREVEKRQQALQDSLDFVCAVEALEKLQFVAIADRLTFKRGETAYVNSLTNFVSLSDDKATVQISPVYSGGGPNGVGGITLDGRASNIHLKTDKKGNITFTMNVMGTGISASITIQLSEGSNRASVTVNSNMHSNRVTLYGYLMPADASSIYKGRAL